MSISYQQKIPAMLVTGICTAFIMAVAKISVPDSGTGSYQFSTPVTEVIEVAAELVPDPVPPSLPVDIETKKLMFVSTILPEISAQNLKLRAIRARLSAIGGQARPNVGDQLWLDQLRTLYKIPRSFTDQQAIEVLTDRVDVIPASLVLAQAAMESGWGTSRFARSGNNYFGQWCMKAGCGMVPLRRDGGAGHEVKTFESIAESIQGYFMNINTNRAYRSLRELRACQRGGGESLDGALLAGGLESYSAIGDLYIENLRRIIRVNRWHKLVEPESEEGGVQLRHFSDSICHVGEPDTQLPGNLQATHSETATAELLAFAGDE